MLPRPRGTAGLVLWFLVVLGGSTVVLFTGERLARRALPLAALLKMTMAFPDRAPTRLAVARRAGTTKSLERRLAEAQEKGIHDELSVAAEKILALAAALNVHDRRTRGHSERVRAYAELIAEQLKLPQRDRDRLRWSALLHDVGKLTVHPDILNKGGQPSPEEWEVLKRHPLEGAKLTEALAGWLGPWAQTIAEHHERFDGLGYPHGLAGEQISLGGRIVAVADSYEVMTAVRSYKSAMSPPAARRELAACAGGQFDPQVVRALLEVSLGRMRLVAGPLAWLGQLPLINGFSNLAQLGSIAGRSVMTGFAAAGGVVAGVTHAPSSTPAVDLAVTHPAAGPGATSARAGARTRPGPATPATAQPTTQSTTVSTPTSTTTSTTNPARVPAVAATAAPRSGGTGTAAAGPVGSASGNGASSRPSSPTAPTPPASPGASPGRSGTAPPATPGSGRPAGPTAPTSPGPPATSSAPSGSGTPGSGGGSAATPPSAGSPTGAGSASTAPSGAGAPSTGSAPTSPAPSPSGGGGTSGGSAPPPPSHK